MEFGIWDLGLAEKGCEVSVTRLSSERDLEVELGYQLARSGSMGHMMGRSERRNGWYASKWLLTVSRGNMGIEWFENVM